VIIATVFALALTACGGGGKSTSTAQSQPPKRSIQPSRQAADSIGQLQAAPQSGADAGINFAGYDDELAGMVDLLNRYWKETEPKDYSPPSDVIAYNPSQPNAPRCGNEPPARENAVYCGPGDFIAWDEPGLFIPFYRDKGDMAVGFILAHEWGHLVQERLGLSTQFKNTIEAELNADCLAGSWAGWLADQGQLDPNDAPGKGGDIDSALDAIFSVGDPPSVPWQDPDAHGTGEERATAYRDGYEGGVDACAKDYGPGFTSSPGAPAKASNGHGDFVAR
jgi:Putative neutral zinc metallopeptidase